MKQPPIAYTLNPAQGREFIAAVMERAPWWAKGRMAALIEDDTAIDVTIAKHKRKHTSSQQGYYWLCVGIFAKSQGMSPDEAHHVILCEATGSKEVEIGPRTYLMPVQRSSKMSVEEYGNLIETLHRVAAFCDCALPDPQEVA